MPQWYASGIPLCTFIGNQYSPQITTDGAGGAIVTWSDENGRTLDIFAQRITSSGTPVWEKDGVPITIADGNQAQPQIASDNSGGAIITWSSAYNSDVFAQRINSLGAYQWVRNGVALCTAFKHQYNPQIVSDGEHGAIVAWNDLRPGSNSSFNIYAQLINGSGELQCTTSGVALCTDPTNQGQPLIASDGAGGAVVAWIDQRSGNPDVYARKLTNTGVAGWTANGVAVCNAPNSQEDVQLVSNGSGGGLLTWVDFRVHYNDRNIYASRVSVDGGIPVPVSLSRFKLE